MKYRINNKFKCRLISVFTCITICFALIVGAADMVIPKQKTVENVSEVSEYTQNISSELITEAQAKAKVFGIPLKDVDVNIIGKKGVIPSGAVFGVKFFTKGVIVVGMSDVEGEDGIKNPAYSAGIRAGDIITKINDTSVNTVEEVGQYFAQSNGNELSIEYERNGEINQTSLRPIKTLTTSEYKSGLWIRDSTAGIGTITFYDPETGNFGGLGHGICDVDTGKLMPMRKGNIVDISITDIVKGINGEPGELKGAFGNVKTGELYKNTEEGVFGKLYSKPQSSFERPVEIGMSNEIYEGEAHIYTSLGDGNINKYSIKLTKIYKNDADTKNFIFEVTDRELLERTGGIVQGMSGSPIIQGGKIIGAVTHVMVNDPTKGYGIFIENMLSQLEKN